MDRALIDNSLSYKNNQTETQRTMELTLILTEAGKKNSEALTVGKQ